MHDAPRRLNPREALSKAPANWRRWADKGRIGRRRATLTMPTTRQRWPAAANAARQMAILNQQRQIQIYHALLRDAHIYHDNALARLIYEAMALAEQTLRELGEAKPYRDDTPG